jgi:WD40 repeat protein
MPRTIHYTALVCLAFFASGLATTAASAQEKTTGGRYALLIGVKKYDKNELRNLPYAEDDMEGLARALIAGGYAKKNVILMTQKAAATDDIDLLPTRANILRFLREYLKGLRPTDSIVVAFAGHGVQFEGEDEHYFCPADAKLGDKENTLIRLPEVYKELSDCQAGFKLLLVDACRNDPVSDFSRTARPTVKLDGGFRTRAAPPGGVVAIYSCRAGQKAYEHDQLKHGVFFHFLIKGLSSEADGNKDGKVTLNELGDYLHEQVPAFTFREFRVKQLPERQGVESVSVPLVMVSRAKVSNPDLVKPAPPPVPPVDRMSRIFRLHSDIVWGVALSTPTHRAASASKDGTIRLIDTDRAEPVRTFTGHQGAVQGVAFSKSGALLVSGGSDQTVRVWSTTTGKEIRRLAGHKGGVCAVAMSGDSKWIMSGGTDNDVLLWDALKFPKHWHYQGHKGAVRSVAISNNGKWMLSGGQDEAVCYWSASKTKPRLIMRHDTTTRDGKRHDGVVYGVALAPDGETGLSGSADRTMRLWNLTTGREVRRFVHPDEVNSVAFSPDGRFALSGCDDGKVRLWEIGTGRLLKLFQGHDALVFSVAYSRDGRYALSGSFDKTVRLWSLDGGTLPVGTDVAPPPPPPSPPPTPTSFVSPSDLQISVRWNTNADVDLHVMEPNGEHCSYTHALTRNGGRLLNDNTTGYGPEEYQAVQAATGKYVVRLHLFRSPNNGQRGPTTATVTVRRYVGTSRETTRRYTVTLRNQGQYQNVCTLNY